MVLSCLTFLVLGSIFIATAVSVWTSFTRNIRMPSMRLHVNYCTSSQDHRNFIIFRNGHLLHGKLINMHNMSKQSKCVDCMFSDNLCSRKLLLRSISAQPMSLVQITTKMMIVMLIIMRRMLMKIIMRPMMMMVVT